MAKTLIEQVHEFLGTLLESEEGKTTFLGGGWTTNTAETVMMGGIQLAGAGEGAPWPVLDFYVSQGVLYLDEEPVSFEDFKRRLLAMTEESAA